MGTVFISIIIIASGILDIILFFKIWRMTNDVRRMSKKIEHTDFLDEICIAYTKEDMETAAKLAKESFFQEVTLLAKSKFYPSDFLEEYESLKTKYTYIFKRIGKPAPDFKKYENKEMYLL